MKPELESKLVKDFPLCFGDYNKDMTKTAMCWGCECNEGWEPLIRQLCEKLEPLIQAHLEKYPEIDKELSPRFSQVKEKYGTLRVYMTTETDEMYKLINEAEDKSAEICEQCGATGKLRGRGWVYTACYNCAKEEDKDNLELLEKKYDDKDLK